MIAIIITGITIGTIILGSLLGLLRGMNRSILRLVLIIACAVASFFLMSYLTDMILSFELKDGVSIRESILAIFGDTSEFPASLINLIMAVIEIICGLLLFLSSFLILASLSWMIIFPIFKIFIRPGKNRRSFAGLLVGALQGVFVAFIICAPISGLTSEVSKLSELEINGQKILPIPEEIELSGYENSTTYKFYNATGGWFYELLSSKETETGTNVSISDTVEVVITTKDVVEETTNLTNNLDKVGNSETTVQEKVESLKGVGDSLINIGTSINNMSDGGKEILKEVIIDVVSSFVSDGQGDGNGEGEGEGESALPPAIQEVIENLDFDNFSITSTGEAIKGISSYIEKTDESFENYGEEVTQEEVDSIVNGVADNSFILDIITGGAETPEEVPTLIEVKKEDTEKFESAISQTENLTDEQKQMLKKLLGLN